jgi:DNA-binding Lrp family transcriptional regulator
MENLKQEVEETTKVLQNSPEELWKRIRFLLKEKGIDPAQAVVACSFLEDFSFEYGIVVSKDEKIYQYGFDFLNKEISAGTFKEWEDITETYHKLHYKENIEIALQMLKERNR